MPRAVSSPDGPTLHTLANGLRVAHLHHPGHLAGLYLWFDAGTADEKPGEEGAAHLLEHMLFKGSERLGIGEAAAAIEALGGDLNAYTTWDQTVLHATVLAEGWEHAIGVLADMAWNSSLDPEELAREKPVVLEEIRGYAADPESVVDDAVAEALFPDHPYGRPVLGTEASVTGLSREDLHRFWRTHYTAGRAVLGVVGPMTWDEVLACAERLEPPVGPGREALESPGVARQDRVMLDGTFDTPVVVLAFRTPGDDHPDLPALEVLASTLGSGRAALLPSRFRYGSGRVADIWSSTYARRFAGSFEIGFIPTEGHAQDVLDELLHLLERPGALSSEDIRRGRANLLTDLIYADTSVENHAHDVAWFTARAGHPRAKDAWRTSIAAVTPADVRRVAAHWLRSPTLRALLPDAPALEVRPSPRQAPQIHVVRAAEEDEALDQQGPLTSLYLGWPGGLAAETPETAGWTDAWSSMVCTGAGRFGNIALASELDRYGASLRSIAGRNTLGLQLTAPSTHMDAAVDLLVAVLHSPRFDEREWKRVRAEGLFELDTLRDRPEEVLQRRLGELAWPGHPWGFQRTRTSLRKIRPEHLASLHQTLDAERLVVGVAGPVVAERAEAWLHRLESGLPRHHAAFVHPTPGAQPVGHYSATGGTEQALVVAATRVPSLHDPRTTGLRVGFGLLSAQSGPLFLDLRERRSLAYAVWARMFESPAQGLATFGLATEPSRAVEARGALLEAIERFTADGPTEAELERTRAMLLGQLASAEQSASGRALRLGLAGLYGLPHGSAVARQALRDVTADDVRSAFRSLPTPFTVTVRPRG